MITTYIESLIGGGSETEDDIDLFPEQNVMFVSGALGGLYQMGVTAYLSAVLVNETKNATHKIKNIYGTSAGAVSGPILAYLLNVEKPTAKMDEWIQLINTKLHAECQREDGHIIRAWINLLDEFFPENIHEFCSDKVFITMTVFENYRASKKVVHKYLSKQHLLHVISTAMSIPFITIPTTHVIYKCPFENRDFHAVDGITIAPIVENDYPTLYVNIFRHFYPFFKRLHTFWTQNYDFLVINGIQDAHVFFRNDNGKSYNRLFQSREKTLYYDFQRGDFKQAQCFKEERYTTNLKYISTVLFTTTVAITASLQFDKNNNNNNTLLCHRIVVVSALLTVVTTFVTFFYTC